MKTGQIIGLAWGQTFQQAFHKCQEYVFICRERRTHSNFFFLIKNKDQWLFAGKISNKIFSNLLHEHLCEHLRLNQNNCCIMRNFEQTVKCLDHASIKLDLVLLHKTARHKIVILSPSCGFFYCQRNIEVLWDNCEGELEIALL